MRRDLRTMLRISSSSCSTTWGSPTSAATARKSPRCAWTSTRHGRRALQQLPRHGHVLAHAGLPADRAQRALGRRRRHRRMVERLSGLPGPHQPARAATRGRDPSPITPTAPTPSASGTCRTPRPHQTAAGPHDHWPLGRGFSRWYGFLGGYVDRLESPTRNRPIRPCTPRPAATT